VIRTPLEGPQSSQKDFPSAGKEDQEAEGGGKGEVDLVTYQERTVKSGG